MTLAGHQAARPLLIAIGGLVLVLLAGAARADDAELFLSEPGSSTARANVLFLIDTSGSMDTLVATQAPFDSKVTFAGCYDSKALYFSTTGTVPACDNPNRLAKAANRCTAAARPLASVGYYADALLGWDSSRRRWDALSATRPDGAVECESDRGIDGDGSSGRPYAANGAAGPWADNADNEPAWTTQYTIYDGNWLNWRSNPPTVEKSRIDIVKEAVNALTASLRNVNVGVMRFNGDTGGSVIAALDNIETSRASVTSIVDGLEVGGATPLSEALYEATRYFQGANVDYGGVGNFRSVAASRVGNSSTSTRYRTPIVEPCAKNYIILLTDGEPNKDGGADSKITALPGFNTIVGAACDGSGEGRCLDDLAAYLAGRDLNDSLPGVQNVITHTIGFEVNFPLLVATAARGGGEYHLADDTASLSTALSGIILSIFDNAGSFAAPAVPVNSFNRTQNLDDVFISVFQPTETTRWLGNLKKYRLANGTLVGQDGRPVIDSSTGLFARDAFSFWSATRDGDNARKGGAASRLPVPAVRRLFTNLAGGNLTSPGNRVSPDSQQLLAALSSVPPAERQTLVNWALGRDTQDADQDGDRTEARLDMGDSLHVQPLTLLYSGTAARPVASVFLATNDGYLHAFDAETGEERWAFIPSRLLNPLYPLYRNEAASSKTYGLDGEINLVIQNDDRQPGLAGSERAILLFGMGRGGDGVFALDVTDRDAPKLLWEISSSDREFADLGQTWSSPVAAQVRIGGAIRNVAVFGGGYDPGQDSRSFRQDTLGNAIYMVDLLTGDRLWSAGNSNAVGPHDLELPGMQYSIPAPVKPLDLNGDGLADRFYVGDMGGQLWRFDIVNGEARGSLVEGGILASLGGAAVDTPSRADLRRFYESPDVVPAILNRKLVITINLGSGYRGHPLDTTIDEAFFSVRDFNVFGVIDTADYPTSPVSIGQLVDITGDATPNLPFASAGWKLRLTQGAGEKVLGESVTFDNTTFFTSFTPGETASECAGGVGTNRLYAVSLLDGRPRTNFDSPADQPLTVDDRARILNTGVPVTDVSLLRTASGLLPCAGLECLSEDERKRLDLTSESIRRTYWFPREGKE